MATFYLLPARPFLAERFADSLRSLFPGSAAGRLEGAELTELLTRVITAPGDVYVIHREDLPPGEGPLSALMNSFGAEPGDEVIEVHAGARPGEWTSRRWRLKPGAAAA